MSNPSGTPLPPEQDETLNQAFLAKDVPHAASFFEGFDQYDCQELISFYQSHWMLSSEDFKFQTDPPMGMISRLNPGNSNNCIILIPEDPDIPPLDYREVHQLVRELTFGICVFNQTPSISLEANFDKSTACQLPPAYIDTRVGQLLISVDYMLKSLWHGAYFPKDKRIKFSERWKSNYNTTDDSESKKPLLREFLNAGMIDITSDPDYTDIYKNLPFDQTGDPEMVAEKRFFKDYVEYMSMQMTFYQNSVTNHKDMYVMDSDWLVSSVLRILDDQIDAGGYERVNTRLQMHEQMIKENLTNKQEVRRNVYLLKIVSFLVPFLIGMRKRMKIPEMNKLLTRLTGDECRTERVLPPLILGQDFKCKNFDFGSNYFHLHGGILFDLETDPVEPASESFTEQYDSMIHEASDYLKKILDPTAPLKEHYKIPTQVIDGKMYYVVMLEFETFYPQNPFKPIWMKGYHDEIMRQRFAKNVSNFDLQITELFKKIFGFKRVLKLQAPMNGLKAAAQRGLVAVFIHLCRKMQPPSRLTKQDEQGLSLLHHAAMNNRPQVIAHLLLQSMDLNVRRNNVLSTDGGGRRNTGDSMRSFLLEMCPTSLHIACRCGALDATACLIANFANILATDQDGWAPIHHAAFFDHEPIIKLMVRKNFALMELVTKNDTKSTPLLLAASSGGLSAVKCLIRLGADINKVDADGNGMVNLAAMRFHTNVLEYLIEWNHIDVPVWKILVRMLNNPDLKRKDSAVKCLEVLSISKPEHWKSVLDADGVPALVNLLRMENEELQSVAASVLVNIAGQDEVRVALTKAEAGPVLIQLLNSPVDDIQSRTAILMADLACIEGNQDMLSEKGAVAPIVNLLDSELLDVLVNSVKAITVLCVNNKTNQDQVAACGGLDPLVEFLSLDSEDLQAATAAAIASVSAGNKEIQDEIIAKDAVQPLVDLIKNSKNSHDKVQKTIQVNAANAIEALAENNPTSQKAFIDIDAPRILLKLFKNFEPLVREQGACALWALAGSTKMQQRDIAEKTTIQNICGMLLGDTEKLLQVGCKMAIALGHENIEKQNKLAQTEAFSMLVRRLRHHESSSDKVLLMVIRVLGILCVGVAYTNNKVTQRKIAEEGAIYYLVQLLNDPPTQEVQVEVAIALGCIVLSNPSNQEKLQEEKDFKFDVLLDLLGSEDENIRLRAGMALTIFSFNNTPQQFAIREAGGIKYSVFEQFITSLDEYFVSYAAFQIVVLARVIVDQDQVNLTAEGVTLLVSNLRSKDDNAIVLAASLLSSLAHTRAGITDAMVTTGAIEILVEKLSSNNDQVRNAVAVTLGYLTYNRTAARVLFSACRNTPGLYKKLMENIGKNARINEEFVGDFKRAIHIGLPSQCLEINGGPPVIPPSRNEGSRPTTTQSGRRKMDPRIYGRAKSAPSHRGKKSPAPSIVISKSSQEESRPSTSQVNINVPRSRPISGSSSRTRKQTPSPDSAFKTKLSAWKNEK